MPINQCCRPYSIRINTVHSVQHDLHMGRHLLMKHAFIIAESSVHVFYVLFLIMRFSPTCPFHHSSLNVADAGLRSQSVGHEDETDRVVS